MLVVVDRIEGRFVVIEFQDRTTHDVPLEELPLDVKSGDCFWYRDGKYVASPEETAKRRAKIQDLIESTWDAK